jgi:subtilisin family serine protease
LEARGADRAIRHQEVVQALQAKATATQAALLSLLEEERAAGRVSRVEPYWIVNAVALRAQPAVIRNVARRSDVAWVAKDRVETLPVEPEIPPDLGPASADGASSEPGGALSCPAWSGIEPGLIAIGVPDLWDMGITGEEVLIGTLDTGADLVHPAIGARWRGHEPGVEPSEAWFDYWDESPVPEDTTECGSHGTHVMGTLLGRETTEPGEYVYQIGVAPGAHWIAARVFGAPHVGCSSSDASKLAGWQWLADPDGDPGTVDDVPHVINRSGGEKGPNGGLCRPDPEPIWEAIRAVEAGGSLTFFGAGNEGPDPETIISWASRIDTPTHAFAVGNVYVNPQATPWAIWNSSSRGPSPCDGATIKPELAAPGTDICSSVLGGYAYKTGTSMSTPHVAGGAALLRQAFPGATGQQIKTALLLSAHDMGAPGEDNDYGTGLLNVADAHAWLAAQESMYVHSIQFRGTTRFGVPPRHRVNSRIRVFDGEGQPLPGALVTARLWSPNRVRVRRAVTDPSGGAVLGINSVRGGTWKTCILDVKKEGYVYQPLDNRETCDWFIYP